MIKLGTAAHGNEYSGSVWNLKIWSTMTVLVVVMEVAMAFRGKGSATALRAMVLHVVSSGNSNGGGSGNRLQTCRLSLLVSTATECTSSKQDASTGLCLSWSLVFLHFLPPPPSSPLPSTTSFTEWKCFQKFCIHGTYQSPPHSRVATG